MPDQNPNEPRKVDWEETADRHPRLDAKAAGRESQDRLVVLATFDNGPEAHCLRIELEHHGIPAKVSNENSAQTIGASLFGRIASIWVEVVVLEKDLEKALEVKNGFSSANQESEIAEWECSCGETVDAGFAQCWSCMKPHPNAG